jgi:ribonuclease T1
MRQTRLPYLLRPVALAFLLALLVASTAHARRDPEALATVSDRELPREAKEVLTRIEAGGPFSYDRDGVVFGNRERILPGRARGYYHEYTVHTPGERTRGARRIVCGGPQRTPDACFYSDDHYQSFRRIVH